MLTRSKTPAVLIIGNFLSNNGGNRGVCEELAAEFSGCGWDVLTTSSQPGKALRLLDMLANILRYRNAYHVAQVDVFSGPAFLWAELSSLLLHMLKKPYILTLHGGNLPRFAKRWPSRIRRVLRAAAIVTTPSKYLLEQMRAYREDLCLLPNPIKLGAYPFRQRNTPTERLIWLRAFHEIYNPTLAPRVLALLKDEFPNIHLTMIGPDKGDGSLQKTRNVAGELGVLDRIEFPGAMKKEEVPGWLDQGDIFINTTNFDNTPVSVIEAMACGLCVISTNVGGIPYLLESGKDSLLVAPDDPKAMADAVCRVFREPKLAQSLSCNARKKVEEFDWSIVLPQWEQLFESVKIT